MHCDHDKEGDIEVWLIAKHYKPCSLVSSLVNLVMLTWKVSYDKIWWLFDMNPAKNLCDPNQFSF